MYVRLAFSEYTNLMIRNLAENIQKNHNLFHSQLSEKAGLGCHNFHITLVGRLRKQHERSIRKVFREIRDNMFSIKVMYIQVTRNGCVKLIVQRNHKIIQIINHIMGHIPDGNGYFSNTHITIGTYFGKDVDVFCQKLNNSYPLDNFIIEATTVELDEDATINVPKVKLI